MSHGSGGTASRNMIEGMIIKIFSNTVLDKLEDSAILQIKDTKLRLAFTTDSYVVSPIFFPGGNIGEMAVNGTVNDLAVSGADPLWLSVSFILEEGFEIDELTGEIEKGTISETLEKEIKDLIDSDYSEYKIDKGDAPTLSQRKVSWQKVKADGIHKERYTKHRKNMRSVIGKLKRKIQLYGNPNKLTITNQKRGKLNKRMLHRIPSGRDDLFKVEIRKEDNPLDVCLLVDESGSMRYRCMDMAREACIAVKESLEGNDKLNLWVFGHSGDENERFATEMYEYASPTMKDRPTACGAMTARFENRDGTAIIASAEKVRNESSSPTTQKLMIIFSDGAPSAAGYRGQMARDHVRKSVKKAESMGFNIIQVGFSGAYRQDDMFDNHIFVENIDKLPIQIGKILQKVMKL